MHPILFRIPLPHWPLRLWWALAVMALLAAAYALLARRRGDRSGSLTGAGVAVAMVVLGIVFRGTVFEAGSLPIFSFGVMLGLSLIIGWFATLRLAARAGIEKDTVANCFLVSGLFAVAGARLLYVLTNLDQFDGVSQLTNLRSGGYTLYGGLLGGVLGSWVYLRHKELSVLRWGDLAAPALCAGLFLSRIGCYLFGCDFGSRLGAGAPGWLQKLGTFPHWTGATQDAGEGSGAYLRQKELLRGTGDGLELAHRDVSFPVHPTQIYEALTGLALLGLCVWMRRKHPVQGRTFTALVFTYGLARYVIEFVRDDPDHRAFGPAFSFHVMIAGGLALFALGYALGIARVIADDKLRLGTRIAAFVPAVVAFLAFRPGAFVTPVEVQLSVSQWLALATGLVAAYVFGNPPRSGEGNLLVVPARTKPVLTPEPEPEPDEEDDDDVGDSLPAPAKV